MRCVLLAVLTVAAASEAVEALPLYKQAGAPIPSRVADLLARMTPLELAGQLQNKNEGGWDQIPNITAQFGTTGIGSLFLDEVLNRTWGHYPLSTPLDTLRARNALQSAFLASTRLSIPISFCEELLHTGGWGGTLFPGPPALAQTFNTSLVQAIGAAIAVEGRATGVDTGLSPVVNLFSDPRFGRYHEGYSADPGITAKLAVAMVLGLQGGPAGAQGADTYLPSFNSSIIAQSKHFAAYGHAAGGLNAGVAEMTNRSLLDIYLRPWRSMVAGAGLRSAMVSHQTVHDVPSHANSWLINTLLRGEYGFGDGFTISDEMDLGCLASWGWDVADNISSAAAVALHAGVDIDLQSGENNATMAYAWLLTALEEGLISLEDLRTAAGHVLTMKFAAGLFDNPLTPEEGLSVLNSPAHRELALEAARQGIVLAMNTNATLPLTPKAGTRVALIGPMLSCNFTYSADGSADVPASRLVLRDPTPTACHAREAMVGAYALDDGVVEVQLLPEALSALLPPGVSITVTQGASVTTPSPALIPPAVAAAAAADVAIVMIGDTQATCSEGTDRRSLDVPGGQLALLQALAAQTTTPIVVVLLHGRPTTFGPDLGIPVLSRVNALLIASNPGALGAQAIAEVLLGITNPSGRLPDSWMADVGHLGSSAQPFMQPLNGNWRAQTWHNTPPVDPE